ncbi:hypothetical protein [Microbacterium thalassium]|uniref:Putative membrane protein n=1 Tax=Microbacterium thalassium TaxID=362649 RepID=A0A7X0FMW0_9MICO|nr:hypothetical protein [Microbacterium thalassium]MBB6390440.1 putative membrane protein [Microbacterium thalassium]GLK25549.1 hypothetical protein GCM10017607_28680 [Microbacterium thalassium]
MSTSTSPQEGRRARLAAVVREFDGRTERSLESLAITGGVVSFIAVASLALLVFRLDAAPISGPGSIGQFAAISGAVVAMVSFVVGRFVVVRRHGERMRLPDYLDTLALAVAHGVIALLTWTLLSVILEESFIGAEVFALPLLVLAGAAAAVTGYLAFYSATHMDLMLLAVLLAVFLAEGIVASMLTASDPLWWQDHLSSLGVTGDISALAFNLTLIVAGLIVTTLARYVTIDIPTPHPTGLRNMRVSLILVGILLALVGVFHVDRFFWIHTFAASGMAIAFGVAAIGIRWWIPDMPKTFMALGWWFFAVILLLAVYYAFGIYTLTAVELVAGVLVFTWIILLIRNAAALQADTQD